MVNCQNHFGSNERGKLFEPRDLATNNLVIGFATGIETNKYWLGINDIDTEGIFQYATGGDLVFTNWFNGEPNNYGVGEDCVESYNYGGTNWGDYICELHRHSICEMI